MPERRGSPSRSPNPGGILIPIAVMVIGVFFLWTPSEPDTDPPVTSLLTLSDEPLPTSRFPTSTSPGEPVGRLTSWAGTLPDGTDYRITASRFEQVTGRSVAIAVDVDAAHSPLLGITRFTPVFDASGPTTLVGERLQTPAGAWMATTDMYPAVVELLGPEAEAILTSGVRAHTSMFGHPVLDLAWPFRLAGDNGIPLQMEIRYESFIVRRCSPKSTCSYEVEAVSTVDLPAGSGIPDPPGPQTVERIYDHNPITGGEFDGGPLKARSQFAQFWTGSELLIWGGSTPYGSTPMFDDGAAFDPETRKWRIVATGPIGALGNPLAVWSGTEMIVVGGKQGAAYDPVEDRWRRLPDLEWVPAANSSVVFADGRLVLWSPVGDHAAAFDPLANTWKSLDRPGLDVPHGRLLVLSDDVYAIGREEYPACQGLVLARLGHNGAWEHLAPAEMSTLHYHDCGSPGYAGEAGGRIYVHGGGGRDSRFRAYDPDNDEWVDLPTPPLHGCEGWPGPSALEGKILINGGCDHQAIYNPADNTWKELVLPDMFAYSEWVWTGTEALTWGSSVNPALRSGWRFVP